MDKHNGKQLQTKTWHVQGMHCANCEVLIEKKIRKIPHVRQVQASLHQGTVRIVSDSLPPSLETLKTAIGDDQYSFSEQPTNKPSSTTDQSGFRAWLKASALAFLVIVVFSIVSRSGVSSLIDVSSTSSLASFFLLGLVAGVSSCAALVGGLILSVSRQWADLYADKEQRFVPPLLFNLGRLVSFGILGGLLGLVGTALRLAPAAASVFTLLIALLMIVFALQMLGVRGLQKFQISLPKQLSHYISDEHHFRGRYMPFLMGAATFFLPCGFTITAQGLALASGNLLQGSLIMLSFALGTLPMLLGIGVSSMTLAQKPSLSALFYRFAGILVLFFAFFTINSQFNVLGLPSLYDITHSAKTNEGQASVLADGKQVIKMDASSRGYTPAYFQVQVGIPVRWEITDTGTSGCTSAVIAPSLFSGEIDLTRGQTAVKEFTPTQTGKYKFSCWMGMVTGIIEVVDDLSPSSGPPPQTTSGNTSTSS